MRRNRMMIATRNHWSVDFFNSERLSCYQCWQDGERAFFGRISGVVCGERLTADLQKHVL
jgi:hypothetical protein